MLLQCNGLSLFNLPILVLPDKDFEIAKICFTVTDLKVYKRIHSNSTFLK